MTTDKKNLAQAVVNGIKIKRTRVGSLTISDLLSMTDQDTFYNDTFSNVKIARIQVNNNNLTGFKVNIKFGNGQLQLTQDSNNSVVAVAEGTRATYTWSVVKTSAQDAGVGDILGTADPAYPNNILPSTTTGTDLNFNTQITQATYKKFDINMSVASDQMKKLLIKTGYSYQETLSITLADL